MFTGRLRFLALLFVSWTVLASVASASPITVNMHFVGPGSNNAGGVYTYPYNFSINGGPSTPLICDAYNNEITGGETWQANVVGLLSGKGLFGASPVNYKAAAILYSSILNGSISANSGNFAIWALFAPNATSNGFYQSNGIGALDQWALTQAKHTGNGAFRGFVLYTPIAGTQSWGRTPQEFIGYNPNITTVPEPGTLALLGTGLVSIAGAVRKKLQQA